MGRCAKRSHGTKTPYWMANDTVRQAKQRDDLIQKINTVEPPVSLRTADVFPVVPKSSEEFFGGREATTGNTSAVPRLASHKQPPKNAIT